MEVKKPVDRNTLCPRCGSICENIGSVFMCNYYGCVFSPYEANFLSDAIFSGKIKTESTIMQTIERHVGMGGEGDLIVLRRGGGQGGD